MIHLNEHYLITNLTAPFVLLLFCLIFVLTSKLFLLIDFELSKCTYRHVLYCFERLELSATYSSMALMPLEIWKRKFVLCGEYSG